MSSSIEGGGTKAPQYKEPIGEEGGEETVSNAPGTTEQEKLDSIISTTKTIMKHLDTLDELVMAESVQTYGESLTKEDKKKMEKALSNEGYVPPPEEGEAANTEELISETKHNPLFQNIPYNRITANAHLQQRSLSHASMIEADILTETMLADLKTAKENAAHILAAAEIEKEGLRKQALFKLASAGSNLIIGLAPLTGKVQATTLQPLSHMVTGAEGAASAIVQGETAVKKAIHEQQQRILESAQKNLQSMMENANREKGQMVSRIKDVLDMLNTVLNEQSRTHSSFTHQRS